MLRPLADRNFRLLWTGHTISLLGDGVFTVALVWQTLELSSAPAALGVVSVARAAPRLLFLIVGGVASDRIGRRPLLLASDLSQAVAVGLIALLGWTGDLELWHLIVLSIVVGTANGFFLPSFTAILPDLVPPEQLVQANALATGSRLFAAQFLGPALGGVLIGMFGAAFSFGLDALSFLASAAALFAMRLGAREPRPSVPLFHEVKEGLAYTRSEPWLWVSLITAGAGNLLYSGALTVVVPLFLENDLGTGADGLGAYFAAIGLGGGIAALASGRIGMPRRSITVIYSAWGVSALLIAALGISPAIWIVVAVSVLLGAGLEYGNIIWAALVQQQVPQRLLARVSSLDWFLSLGLQPVSFALAAPVTAALGAPATLVGAGLIDVAILLVGLTRRGVRDPERQPTS